MEEGSVEMTKRISGKHGAAGLIVCMASLVWIIMILGGTIYETKTWGLGMPYLMWVAYLFCLVATPILSIMLSIIIHFDRHERLTEGFLLSMLYGLSPALVILTKLF